MAATITAHNPSEISDIAISASPLLRRRVAAGADGPDVAKPRCELPTPGFVGAEAQALSLDLDALRFGAAFTVFVSPWAGARYSGGLFWQLRGYGRASVIVFFVLSGSVIAWVTETRERSFEDYAFS